MQVQTSEWVSVGHPDKVADFISSYVLDRWIERDPDVRYAVEVQVKDNHVTLAGEVTSTAVIPEEEIKAFVRDAVMNIGYTHEYAELWGEENALDADRLDVRVLLSAQSPDIAQGVDADGWGDQGIFWGMAEENPDMDYMPADHYLAKTIGENLMGMALDKPGYMGIDIKTQVEIRDGKVTKVIVAVPAREDVRETVERVVDDAIDGLKLVDEYELVVNGTGRYVRHASMGDCGTTGRKLVVDFYGGNCRIGGGSPWTKDGSKADVALNILARRIAVEWVTAHRGCRRAYVSLSSCIGRKEVRVTVYDRQMNVVESAVKETPVSETVAELGLKRPEFAMKCRYGLFAG